jgi:hypothetical protein
MDSTVFRQIRPSPMLLSPLLLTFIQKEKKSTNEDTNKPLLKIHKRPERSEPSPATLLDDGEENDGCEPYPKRVHYANIEPGMHTRCLRLPRFVLLTKMHEGHDWCLIDWWPTWVNELFITNLPVLLDASASRENKLGKAYVWLIHDIVGKRPCRSTNCHEYLVAWSNSWIKKEDLTSFYICEKK